MTSLKVIRLGISVALGAVLLLISLAVFGGTANGGPASPATKKAAANAPGPPTALQLTAEGRVVKALWSPPSSGGAVKSYRVAATVQLPVGKSTGNNDCPVKLSATSCTVFVTSRPEKVQVTIDVYAVNSAGQSTAVQKVTDTSSAPDCTYLGPWANLNNCNLKGRNLTGVNFEDASMNGTSLAGADLAGDSLLSAQITGADLTKANLSNVACDCNLGTSNLTQANLTSAVVPALLYSTNLTKANLTKANFKGASTGNTNTSGATWNDTTCPDQTNSGSDGQTCVSHGFAEARS
jgi:hypothetical protein